MNERVRTNIIVYENCFIPRRLGDIVVGQTLFLTPYLLMCLRII